MQTSEPSPPNDNNDELTVDPHLSSILNHLGQLHHCLQTAYANYEAQTDTNQAGLISALTNRISLWHHEMGQPAKGLGQQIAQLDYNSSKPSGYIQALLGILNSDAFTTDSKQTGKSILRHLIDAVHANNDLLSALNLCAIRSNTARKMHDTLYNQYGYKIRYNESIKVLADEQSDHKIYRCFFRDYLREVLKCWQQLLINYSPPFNLLFDLCKYKDLSGLLLSFLAPQDLQNLSLASTLKYPFFQPHSEALFNSSKVLYLDQTRANRVQTLHDHVMHWRYDEIKKLVMLDPKVLSIVCDYKMNRWQDDSASRPLSALEYSWLAGDENLMVLFEEVGKGQLDESSYRNKELLCQESLEWRSKLSAALKQYAGGGSWGDLKPLWDAAAHWVYGLARHLYQEDIVDEAKLVDVDVFSVACRAVWVPGQDVFSFVTARLSLFICQNHIPANSQQISPL